MKTEADAHGRARWLLASLLLVLAVAGLFFFELGDLTNVLYPPGSPYSDLVLAHWPNARFLRTSIREFHCLPLWNPTQFAGVPFAANPLSGLWYPPNWLLLGLPLIPGFNLLLVLHLCLGGLGAIRLMQRLGTGSGSALVAGLAWALAPKVWAHLGAGHVGLVYAAAWLPWVADAAVRLASDARRTGASVRRLAIVGGLQFLADPRLAAYTAGTLVLAVICWFRRQRLATPEDARSPSRIRGGWSRMRPWVGAALLALVLTAIQWVPLADYVRYTSRSGLSVHESAAFSLPPAYLLGLFWGDRGGFHEWMTYAGVSVLVLALLGWLRLSRRDRLAVALALAAMVLYSLGDNTPLYGMVTRFPGASLLRVPPRIWFLVSLGLACLAGMGVEVILPSARRDGGASSVVARYRGWLNRLGFAAVALNGLLAAGVYWVNRPASIGPFFAFFWTTLSVILCGWVGRARRRQRLAGAVLALLVAAELMWMDQTLVVRRSALELFADGRETAGFLAERGGRVYAPSFRPPPQVAAISNLRIVNGTDPLIPQTFQQYITKATTTQPPPSYVVTTPPLSPDQPVETALAGEHPDPWLLAALDVRQVVSAFPLASNGFELVFRSEVEGLRVYRNEVELQWPAVYRKVDSVPDLAAALDWMIDTQLDQAAVVVDGRTLDGMPGRTAAEKVELTPNRLVVMASGPGLLIVDEFYLPGWRGAVDGVPVQVVAADAILRGVYLGPGEHRVEMVYRPWSIPLGAALSALSLAAFFAWAAWERRRER